MSYLSRTYECKIGFVPNVHTMEIWGSGSQIPHILDIGTMWR